MASVFISYSRHDQEFVRWLYDALTRAGRDAWVDWEDIPPTAAWLSEVYAGLEGADTFLCVLSPDWATSEISQKELAHALEAHKRIVPLVCRDVAPETIAAPVDALNWIFFRPTDNFDAAFGRLLFALDTDLDYWHRASRMLVRAHEWEENRSTVLHGKELAAAEQWLVEGANKQPAPTALQTRFITASRRAAGARQRTWIGLLSAGLLITLVLATVARIEQARADNNAQQLAAQNKVLFAQVLAGEANTALVNNDVDQSLLLSVAASQRLDSVETRNALLNGLEYSPHLAATLYNPVSEQSSLGVGYAVLITHDGRTILAANSPDSQAHGHVSVWDAATHQLRHRFATSDTMLAAAFSADGQFMAMDGPKTGLTLWDANRGTSLAQLAPGLGIQHPTLGTGAFDLAAPDLTFSPNGQVLAAGYCDDAGCAHPYIGLWDPRTQAALGHLPLTYPPDFLSLAFSPDSSRLAVGECNYVAANITCQIELWDWARQSLLYTHPITPADGGGYQNDTIAFSPDGHLLATGGCADAVCATGQILTWNATTGTRQGQALNTPRFEPYALAFSPDGQRLVASQADGTLLLWDVASGQAVGAPLNGHKEPATAIAFSPDGRQFVTVGNDGKTLLWRVGAYSPFSLPQGPQLDGSSNVAISPDGRTMATGGCDGTVRLWDRASGAQRTAFNIAPGVGGVCLASLAFSRDGTQLAAGTDLGPIGIWNVHTHVLVQSCSCLTGYVNQVIFSPDGRSLAADVEAEANSLVELVDLGTGTVTRQFAIPQALTPLGVAFSPDGSLLAVGGGGPNQDGVNVWDTHSGRIAATLPEASEVVGALAFSPNGRVLAALSQDRQLNLWNVQTHALLASTTAAQTNVSTVSLAYRPDGHMLVVSLDKQITLLDVHDPKNLAIYARPFVEPQEVNNVVFSPDGKLLLDALVDGPLNVRYATLDGWRSAACAIANRNFSQAEWHQFLGGQASEPYQKVCPDV